MNCHFHKMCNRKAVAHVEADVTQEHADEFVKLNEVANAKMTKISEYGRSK